MQTRDEIRLTTLVSCAGWAAKLGPEALAQVLRPLRLPTHPDLLIGLEVSDDAAVYRLSEEQALVQTVDFFTPIVDDPYTFGAIAAANALSDIYAMGARPILALAIAGLPESLPPAVATAIFQGGADKVAEAGAVVAGGHTVVDAEPKYGLCVTGLVHPAQLTPKAAARPGDRLLLTKPLGTGLVATALKRGLADPAHVEAAVASMLRLNRRAAELAQETGGAHGATDITGFGLLGHALELARNSGVRLRIVVEALPLLPGALDYAARGCLPGGGQRNRAFVAASVSAPEGLAAPLQDLLVDPQTSGGLLLVLPPPRAAALLERMRAAGEPCWEIGVVEDGSGIVVI